jgi:membrane-associated phospholipid phosphatase
VSNRLQLSARRSSNILFVALGTASLFFFMLIAWNVASAGVLTQLDARLSVWLHSHNSPELTAFFLLVSNLHSNLSMTVVTAAIAAYLWMKHLRYWVLMLAVTVAGGGLLNVGLKILFARARPHLDNPILVLHTFSFPSGHTMLATVFYGTLCVLTFTRRRDWKIRVVSMLLALVMIALVGFSRMYLGVHYLSDVLGAIMEGMAWLALCFLTLGSLQIRRSQSVEIKL